MQRHVLNQIAKYEKAIKEKYGNEAIQNPKKGWDKEKGKIEYFIGISFIELEDFNSAVEYLSTSGKLGQEKLVEPWLQYIDYLIETAS